MPKKEWSNDVQSLDDEVRELTPREQDVANATKEDLKNVKPLLYDITSRNTRALRVVHDYDGTPISIPPGQTKKGVLLRPHTAEYLGRGDLTVTPSVQPAAA